MNNALLYLGGLLVVALAALFAVPHFVDWNGYRGIFEEEASKVLGRDVRVGGAVSVRLLPTPFVSFEKVRLADPTGQTGEPFVSADLFTMRLSGPALLRGVLEANDIELERPELTLALDRQGGGNWTSVQIKSAALPFVPQSVALHSVNIIDGAISIYNADAQQIARVSDVNGEFSADALKGPYKYKGRATWSGEERDVRFATTAPDATGAFQIKTNIRALVSGSAYALDATVENLSTTPRIFGGLTGQIPVHQISGHQKASTGAADATVDAGEPPVLDLKSRFEATTAGAKVTDIELGVENVAEPQLINGSATAEWGIEERLDIRLESKWLDLDRLAGAGQGSATFLKVKQLGLSVLRGLAGNGEASARIEIDQAKLGGETAGSVKIDAERSGTAVRLNDLRAGLPGGSRLQMSGDLKEADGKVSFAGAGHIHGTNIARLLDWAAKSGANLDIKAEGPFSAEGHVLISDDRFELTEASADIGGRPISGDVVVSGDTRQRVAVTLEAASLDSSEVFPKTAEILEASLRRAFGLAALDKKTDTAAAASAPENSGDDSSDISVRVLAGEFKHRDQVFRNVDATARLDGGNISIPSAKLTTASGLTISVDARISGAQEQPKGTLSYDVVANTADAVKDVASITALVGTMPADHLARVTSAKLAGLVRLGSRNPASADITVDGVVQSARFKASAEFDGGWQGWRTDPSRVRASVRSTSLAGLLSAFGFEGDPAAVPGAHEAELAFASSGRISDGAAATLEIDASGFKSSYDGRIAIPRDAPVNVAGVAQVTAESASDLLSAVGIRAVSGTDGVPVQGKFETTRDAGKWSIASRRVMLGGTQLSGSATVAAAADGAPVVSADLQADTVTIAGLLAPLHDVIADAQAGGDGDIWPRGVFNFNAIGRASGDVRLRYTTLSVLPGVLARDGSVAIAFAPGKVAITDLTGKAAGGALSGAVQFTQAASGVAFDGSLKINGARLDQLSRAARGTATIDAKATAQAQSPGGLLAVLSGTGTVALDAVSLPAPGPAVGEGVIAAVLANKIPNQPGDVSNAFQEAVARATADLGSRTIPFVIADGIVKLDAVTLDASAGAVTSSTMLDLTSLAIDSAWQVSARMPPLPPPAEPLPGWVPSPSKGPLPPAAVVYTGNVGELSELAVNTDVSDMQRELAVRQLERNVEELERLRRLDEYRAKQEQDRRRALEAERAAAAAAAKAAASAPPPPVPAPALPPVLPESAGTAAGPQSAAPPVSPSDQSAASAAGKPPVLVEQIPPPAPQPVARPQPARASPPRPSQARRTTSDELMKSLGGLP